MIGLPLLSHFAACQGGSFLGFPHWYEYLPCNGGAPGIRSINDIWLIVAAIIEIMLRIAGIVAVVLVIYGGIQYITSQGEPDKTTKARSTIINALTGLAIAILAASIVAFVAGRFH
jgi:ABC-type Fe3+ transport system permease subunit